MISNNLPDPTIGNTVTFEDSDSFVFHPHASDDRTASDVYNQGILLNVSQLQLQVVLIKSINLTFRAPACLIL